jgi:hypothetical protein
VVGETKLAGGGPAATVYISGMVLILHKTSEYRALQEWPDRHVGRKGLLHTVQGMPHRQSRKALLAPLPSSTVIAIDLLQCAILVPLTLPDEFTWVVSPSNATYGSGAYYRNANSSNG